MRSLAWRFLGGAIVLSAGIILILVISGELLDRVEKWMSILGVLLAVATAIAALARSRRPDRPAVRAEGSADRLAEIVAYQIKSDQLMRGVDSRRRLNIGWSLMSGEVLEAGAPTRMVILGGPGSGKTVKCLLMAQELLRDRSPGGIVPILLDAPTWRPGVRHFDDWVADEVAAVLDSTGRPVLTRLAAEDMIAKGLVLSIVDGFDELPVPARALALAALNRLDASTPLILTSRPHEFETAAMTAGSPSYALIYKLDPVEPAERRRFLRQETRLPHLEPVLDQAEKDSDGAIANALARPLFIWIFKTVYTSGQFDASELLDVTRFHSAKLIERHLLSLLVPALYPNEPRRASERGPRWRNASVSRWLAQLAVHAIQNPTYRIAWWELRTSLNPIAVALTSFLAGAVFCGSTAAIAFWFWPEGSSGATQSLRVSFGAAIVFGVAGGLAAVMATWVGKRKLKDPVPTRVGFAWPRWLIVATCLASFAGFGVSVHGSLGDRVAAFTMFGGLTALVGRFFPGWEVVGGKRVLPITGAMEQVVRRMLVSMVFAATVAAAAAVGAGDVVLLLLVVPVLLLCLLPACLSSEILARPAPTSVSPLDSYGDDRSATLLSTLVCVLVFGGAYALAATSFFTPVNGPAWTSIVIISTLVVQVCVISALASSWGNFQTVRAWCSARGLLPLRLLTFLDDARSRGLLRQRGAAYEFRHRELLSATMFAPAASEVVRSNMAAIKSGVELQEYLADSTFSAAKSPCYRCQSPRTLAFNPSGHVPNSIPSMHGANALLYCLGCSDTSGAIVIIKASPPGHAD